MKEYGRFLAKFVIAFLIATVIGFLVIHFYIRLAENKGFFVQTYYVDDYNAKEDYNEKSVAFLINNFTSTTTIYSPLCVESAYVYYAMQNDKVLDDVYYVFGNGFQNFSLSRLLLQDDSIKCFTVGQAKTKNSVADINAIPNEKLIIDEINAKFNTLSDGKVVFKATQNNVFDYNIYGLCVIDETIDAESNELEETYLVQGTFESYLNDDLTYVVIPFKDSDYELIMKKGIDLYYSKERPLTTTDKELTLILPKLTLESVENPSKYYVKTKLNDDFEIDSTLTNVTTICHLNVHYQQSDRELETTTDAIDFSKNSIFAVRNKKTGQLVIVGSIL